MLGIGLGLTSESSLRRSGTVTPAWTPLDLGAKLKFWVTPDDVGTDDGGGLISSITDRAGGMVLTATTTARPTRGLTSFNSAYLGWTLDGIANCFVSTSLSTIPTGATGGTWFMLISNTEPGTGTRFAMRLGASTGGTDRYLMKTLVTSSRLRISDGTATVTDSSTAFDGPNIVSGSWSGTTQSARINGADTTPASGVIPTLNTTPTRLRLFANNGAAAGGFWVGVSADVIATTDLVLLEHQKLEGWAAWAKGLVAKLPAGHPYKSARP